MTEQEKQPKPTPTRYENFEDGWIYKKFEGGEDTCIDVRYKNGGWTPHTTFNSVNWSPGNSHPVIAYRIAKMQRRHRTDWRDCNENPLLEDPKLTRGTYVQVEKCRPHYCPEEEFRDYYPNKGDCHASRLDNFIKRSGEWKSGNKRYRIYQEHCRGEVIEGMYYETGYEAEVVECPLERKRLDLMDESWDEHHAKMDLHRHERGCLPSFEEVCGRAISETNLENRRAQKEAASADIDAGKIIVYICLSIILFIIFSVIFIQIQY